MRRRQFNAATVRTGHRLGFTLTELLVTLAIFAILMALLLPAVQACRESVRRATCRNNLRQQGLALHEFHDANNNFPAGHDGTAERQHSWCTAILPFIEHENLFVRYDYDRVWNDDSQGSANLTVAETDLKVFLCPSTSHDWRGATDYGGVYGSMLSGLECCFGVDQGWDSGVLVGVRIETNGQPQRQVPLDASSITDGTSHTLLVVEDAGRPARFGGQWANGANCLAVTESVNHSPIDEIYSDHRVGAQVLLADGSVRMLSRETNLYVLGSLATRNGGEPD